MFGSAARKLILLTTLVAPLAAGCTATVYEEDVVYVRHRHNHVVFHDAPNLVYIGDGVYVVQDYGTAVYYVDGSYYYHDDGVWYSAGYWNSPWTVAHIGFVPVHIHHRHHAHYVHYHGGHGAHVVKAPSHNQDHTAASPTHSGHEAAAPTKPHASEPHQKSAKDGVASLEHGRGASDLASKSASQPRVETKSSKMVQSDKQRAEPVSARAATNGPASRPSDDDNQPSRSAPSSKSASKSAPKAPATAAKPSSPSVTKVSASKSKKSKPTRKKSRR